MIYLDLAPLDVSWRLGWIMKELRRNILISARRQGQIDPIFKMGQPTSQPTLAQSGSKSWETIHLNDGQPPLPLQCKQNPQSQSQANISLFILDSSRQLTNQEAMFCSLGQVFLNPILMMGVRPKRRQIHQLFHHFCCISTWQAKLSEKRDLLKPKYGENNSWKTALSVAEQGQKVTHVTQPSTSIHILRRVTCQNQGMASTCCWW